MSQPGQESVRDLAAAYALGALGTDDTREFERLLAGSPDLQRDVAEYREVAALLGLGDSGTGPARRPPGTSARHCEGTGGWHYRTAEEKAFASRLGCAGCRDCCGDCARGGGSLVAG